MDEDISLASLQHWVKNATRIFTKTNACGNVKHQKCGRRGIERDQSRAKRKGKLNLKANKEKRDVSE
jgi:hypothetical protein